MRWREEGGGGGSQGKEILFEAAVSTERLRRILLEVQRNEGERAARKDTLSGTSRPRKGE